MHWIQKYQLFLFDFDGLLVNTEELHYKAYIRLCANRGFQLTWNFERYSLAAHHDSSGLRNHIYAEFPALYAQEPNWNILYEEKKTAFLQILQESPVQLMPGVASLLESLSHAHVPRCVVTHSPLKVIELLRSRNPILNSIPNWITREDYSQPKPHPECYQLAIERFGKGIAHTIGFEDSPRGLKALQGTSAKAVLICPPQSAYLKEVLASPTLYYPSFEAINDQNHP